LSGGRNWRGFVGASISSLFKLKSSPKEVRKERLWLEEKIAWKYYPVITSFKQFAHKAPTKAKTAYGIKR